jgi:hypothetical protein
VKRYDVDRFVPIYRALANSGISFVIIGGQACALWAKQYDGDNKKLRQFYPYTTLDLDLCAAKRDDVLKAGKALHVEPVFPRKNMASPELGVLEYTLEGGKVFIQLLRGGFSVPGQEILDRRQVYAWKEHDLRLEVMHPILCLQEKAAAVCRRDQRRRQDLKHFKNGITIRSVVYP